MQAGRKFTGCIYKNKNMIFEPGSLAAHLTDATDDHNLSETERPGCNRCCETVTDVIGSDAHGCGKCEDHRQCEDVGILIVLHSTPGSTCQS